MSWLFLFVTCYQLCIKSLLVYNKQQKHYDVYIALLSVHWHVNLLQLSDYWDSDSESWSISWILISSWSWLSKRWLIQETQQNNANQKITATSYRMKRSMCWFQASWENTYLYNCNAMVMLTPEITLKMLLKNDFKWDTQPWVKTKTENIRISKMNDWLQSILLDWLSVETQLLDIH